jgi:predicted nuclease of predicted toxin-antitoxin system
MRLLFDQNLSFKLSRLLADTFPESNQVRLLGMEEAEDLGICESKRVHSCFAGRRFRHICRG